MLVDVACRWERWRKMGRGGDEGWFDGRVGDGRSGEIGVFFLRGCDVVVNVQYISCFRYDGTDVDCGVGVGVDVVSYFCR
jgi:hypothetical protein